MDTSRSVFETSHDENTNWALPMHTSFDDYAIQA